MNRIENEPVKKIFTVLSTSNLVKGFSWNLGGSLVSKGAVFITSILAANLLGVNDFGRIGIVQQTTGMMIVFSVMGLSQTAILFVGRSLHSSVMSQKAVVNRIINIGMISIVFTCGVYLILVEYIATEIFGDSGLSYLLALCSLVLAGNTINQIQFGILSGLGKFNNIALTNIFVGIFSVPITYVLMVWLGVEGFVWALISNSVLTLIINRIFIFKILASSKKIGSVSIPSYRTLLVYSSSNVVGAGMFSIASWLALGVLTRKAGLVEVAAFNASMQVFAILYIVPSMLAQVIMSTVSRKGLDKRALKFIVLLVLIFVSISSIFFSLFSVQILSVYSDDLSNYSIVLNWVLVVVVIASIVNILDHYANGLGLIKVRILSLTVFSFFYFGLAVFLVESAADLAGVLLSAYVLRVAVLYSLLHRRLRWF